MKGRVLLGAGLSLSLLASAVPASAEASVTQDLPESAGAEQVQAGERMYLEGLLPSGEPMQAIVQSDVQISGEQLTCVSCHRRSGLSSSEAGKLVLPVSGRILFEPRQVKRRELWASRLEGPGTRPAYTVETLARAIRDGVDPAGRALDPLMPRYPMSDEDMASLIAYLKTLSAESSPGVTDEAMHFATIIAGDVDQQDRKALLDVLNGFVADKNAETRHESDRAARAPWHKDWVYEAYRKWVLHVWELKGPPEGWRAQLETYYEEQPVFAVLSGLADASWEPVHEFCEAQKVPCLFPNTDLPVIAEQDFYSIYFSKGLALEAEALAKHLVERGGLENKTLLQLYREDAAGRTASAAFREAIARRGGPAVQDRPIGEGDTGDAQFWRRILDLDTPVSLVLWLGPEDVERFAASAIGNPDRLEEVYLSGSLVGDIPEPLSGKEAPDVYLAYPFALPEERDRLLVRTRVWLHRKGIPITNERVQANAYFAATLVGGAVKHIIDNYSREYLIERIEHRVDNALMSSVYPRVSLAPEQRFASKGCYIVQPKGGDSKGDVEAVSGWIVP